ncbi:tetratricopeptide repeat protein [Mucilaginibacter terrenus]|uniref:tetratricopeptide repeat protein n=1 Tax=Mucilaginibacter terrenus TaxID=2482727 RepID=UPI001058DA5E|nr:hypothetical protein [Mucilaginibacter terrenus]
MQLKINQDTLADILEQKDYFIRQKRLLVFVKNYIQASHPDKMSAVQDTFNNVFSRYNARNKEAYSAFMRSIALYKQKYLKEAERYMTAAAQMVQRDKEHYLAYQFLTHLGFIQTDRGNFIGAIYNYRMATKEVIQIKDKFKDNRAQAALNINISDLYYKTGFYAQSLNYLDNAWSLISKDEASKSLLSSVIFYNKSENFFRQKNIDSLRAYHKKLNDPRNKNYKIYTYRERTAYYLNLLKQEYDVAIKQILDLKKNKSYVPSELEDQHLADAYYASGQLDSSKKILDRLITADNENNHPEIKYHLYEILAWISGKKGDYKASAENFKLALQQSQENTTRLTQVGNISSQIKIDETENSYIQQTQEYERERLWLIFIVIIAALSLIAVALIYRNVKQKRHYENLLYATKKAELSFINSHEVRKHLTNILGIMDIIQHSDNNKEEYKQCEEYLLSSAKRLDEAIKNISDKINE